LRAGCFRDDFTFADFTAFNKLDKMRIILDLINGVAVIAQEVEGKKDEKGQKEPDTNCFQGNRGTIVIVTLGPGIFILILHYYF
jgi:hypothetical protein